MAWNGVIKDISSKNTLIISRFVASCNKLSPLWFKDN